MTEWLTPKEAAVYLRVDRRTLYRMMAAGELVYYEMASGRRRIRREDLDALLRPAQEGGDED